MALLAPEVECRCRNRQGPAAGTARHRTEMTNFKRVTGSKTNCKRATERRLTEDEGSRPAVHYQQLTAFISLALVSRSAAAVRKFERKPVRVQSRSSTLARQRRQLRNEALRPGSYCGCTTLTGCRTAVCRAPLKLKSTGIEGKESRP